MSAIKTTQNAQDNCNKQTLARAYVPNQVVCELFGDDEALCHGTVFPELYQPFK
jgi:hypothetical protein